MANEKFMNEKDIAAHFDVSVKTVQKWRHAEAGPAFIVVGKNTIRYRPEDVRAYEDSRRKGGTAEGGAQ